MKQYRQDGHSLSLFCWVILWGATALYLLFRSPAVPPRVGEVVLGVGLFMIGLTLLAVYCHRAERLWMAVLPDKGLAFAGRGVIPWEDIHRIERRFPILRRWIGSGPRADHLEPTVGGVVVLVCIGSDLGGPLSWVGGALWVFATGIAVCVVLRCMVVPLLEVLAPIGDRILIHSGRSGTLELRDLSDADEFMRKVAAHCPVSP